MGRRLALAIIVLALLGLADAGYLLSMSLMGDPLSCSLLEGCNVVAASAYSRVFGIPLSAFGVAFYLGLAILAYGYLRNPRALIGRAILAVSIAGALSSAYFMYLQTYLIEAYCIYCLFSAGISVFLLIAAALLVRSAPRTV